MTTPDAVVVGAGPNGLVAAIELARHGLSVLVLEADATPGGGARTAELTLPGFHHDVCSSVHPLAVAAPALVELPLAANGVEWVHAPVCVAHPLDDAPAAVLTRSLATTAERLGADGEAWTARIGGMARDWPKLATDILRPIRIPAHPGPALRFGIRALQPALRTARSSFTTAAGRALFGGLAAHGGLPLERPATAAIGLVLGAAAHIGGWPVPRGGAAALTAALVRILRAHGGTIACNAPITSFDELPPAHAILLDLTARPAAALAGSRLPPAYRRRLAAVRPGAGTFKVDYALSEPIPWRDAACRDAMVVHVGGTVEEVAAAERAAWEGRAAARPFVITAQPSLFDASRAPAGGHTAWAYVHVPTGWRGDATAAIEAQLERFAPGFRDCVLARATLTPAWLERHNANLVGGDISGGAPDLRQTLLRPVPAWNPYRTPAPGVYLCSASTPPGGGIHGMCGRNAARAALRSTFGIRTPEGP